MKQGSVVVGIVSKTHAILAALKVRCPSLPQPLSLSSTTNTNFFLQRNAEELSSYQKKIIPIDSHYGIALALSLIHI